MERRFFNYLLPTLPFLPFMAEKEVGDMDNIKVKKTIKPQRLRKGDIVGLITPGSYAPTEAVEKAIKNIKALGLNVKPGKHLKAKRGYNAGTDQQRLEDLHNMFSDPSVKAIWCVRGGYGCTRLLPILDFDLIKNNPKILVGYSDITALSNAIFQQTGLVSFHGPLGSSDMGAYDQAHIKAILFEGASNHTIQLSAHPNPKNRKNYGGFPIKKGKAQGILAGGNLTVLTAMAGTPYALQTENTLLFLEDIGEKPYRIDRMLTQLRQSTNTKEWKGVILGIFNDCEADPEDESLSLKETLMDRFKSINAPVQYGYPIGHIKSQCMLPIGIHAELNTMTSTIKLLENAVI